MRASATSRSLLCSKRVRHRPCLRALRRLAPSCWQQAEKVRLLFRVMRLAHLQHVCSAACVVESDKMLCMHAPELIIARQSRESGARCFDSLDACRRELILAPCRHCHRCISDRPLHILHTTLLRERVADVQGHAARLVPCFVVRPDPLQHCNQVRHKTCAMVMHTRSWCPVQG